MNKESRRSLREAVVTYIKDAEKGKKGKVIVLN
jgi:hypothetical protein